MSDSGQAQAIAAAWERVGNDCGCPDLYYCPQGDDMLGAGTAAQIDSPRCGTVFLTNVSWDFHDPNGSTYVVNGGICVNYTRSGGDSGGAVINGTATASGIHSDACSSGGVFSMIGLALQTLDQQSSGSNFQVRTS